MIDPQDQGAGTAMYTIDDLAGHFRVTDRTIRSYHARGLLPPPARIGRTPYYHQLHAARLHQILHLQAGGMPLEAIRTLLEPDAVVAERLLPRSRIARTLQDQPALLNDLCDLGVLAVGPDGSICLTSARSVLAVRVLAGIDAPMAPALRALADCLAATEKLVEEARSVVRAEVHRHLAASVGREQALVDLIVEVFRVGLIRSLSRDDLN